MTANVTIHVAKVQRALVVPIAALQWAPPQTQGPRAAVSAGTPLSPWGMTDASLTRTVVAGRNGRLFAMRTGKPTRVTVRVQLVNDTEVAVTPAGAPLNVGDTIVVADTASQTATQQSATSSALTHGTQSTLGRSGGGTR